ncbi:MAG: CvpA family protein [Anaerolineae bacterium]|jgi:hypothetical protein|nr:CvpA family protein [Anaerolineae bacterium]
MMQLNLLFFLLVVVFALVGYARGWNKEVISAAGIILALFALHNFDALLRSIVNADPPAGQPLTIEYIANRQSLFWLQSALFALVVFFAYQTRAIVGEDARRVTTRGRDRDGNDEFQTRIMGFLFGLVNGYLIWGSLWYFMDRAGYPLAPYVSAPPPGSDSFALVELLPLNILAPGGIDTLLTVMVIVAFLIVLILI